ncbi:MAG: Choline-sulfatase [Planctomycetota bacterium]|jgi:arylsulfatase A-like enzyme
MLAASPVFAQSEPPLNVVWISVEDMSPWLACYGDETVATPNIDRLAAEGVRYVNAFATTPVCAPSRSTLITGCWATRVGSMHMRTGNPSKAALARNPEAYTGIPPYEAVPPAEVRCFPELLRREGWFCTNRAKTDYQFRAPDTVWDHSDGQAHWRQRPDPGIPFFAVFNLGVTHESGTFANTRRQPAVVSPDDVVVPPYLPDTPTTHADLARTYDNIAAMDRQVGRLIEELETDGLLETTVVMFFSDHGVGLPRGKRCVYDSGTRVPLIIRWPSVMDRRGIETRVVSFEDFAPTVLSILGIEPPAWMDGVAFAGEFADDDEGLAYIHADRMDAVRDRTRAVTDGRFRYVRNLMPERPRLYNVAYAESIPMMADIHALRASGTATPQQWQIVDATKPAEEFYDTATDPDEVVNLIDAPDHADRIAAMRASLDAWIARTGDLGLIEDEGEMVRTRLWNGLDAKPWTALPTLTITESNGVRFATISCDTQGASLGWRWKGDDRWRIYDGRIRLPEAAATIELLAHRIGYVPRRIAVAVR